MEGVSTGCGASSDTDLSARIARLLAAQLQGVLATQDEDRPYTSLMAFAHTPDLSQLVIATLRETRKHANLLRNPQVSLLVDNRCNSADDYAAAVAISVQGQAGEVAPDGLAELTALFLRKHPQLRDFVSQPGCALLRIQVARYRVISRFDAVETLAIQESGQ